jgi:hypothetical protein
LIKVIKKDFFFIAVPVFLTNSLLSRLAVRSLKGVPPEAEQNALWMLGYILIPFATGVVINRLCRNAWSVKQQVVSALICGLPLLVVPILYSRFWVVSPALFLMPFLSVWFSRRFFDPTIR